MLDVTCNFERSPWTWMLLSGVSTPGAFATVLSTIAGGLIGILDPLGPRDSKQGT